MYDTNFGGIHLIGNLYKCKADITKMLSADYTIKLLNNLIIKSKLTPLKHIFYNFTTEDNKSDGFSAVVILEESHLGLNIHTWPNEQFDYAVQVDVFVCNYKTDNSEKAKYLMKLLIDFFMPDEYKQWVIKR